MRTFFFTVVLLLNGALSFAQADKSQATTLYGRILYHGTIPPPQSQIIEQDIETCGTTHQNIPVKVSRDGGLAQVIVSVEGLGHSLIVPKEHSLIIRNEHCEFSPQISVGTIEQDVEVSNLDPILHNTHIRTDTRAFFNIVQLPHSKPFRKVMHEPGPMTIVCNKHPFMIGFIHVFNHPYHTITDTQGTFSIPNLPPGTHPLTIWHKTLGTIHRTVTIPQKTSAILNIEFPAP